tara:strand:+ start:416 stop:733 length:318 start_codon:yes stop_codon:yes gene_type:complete
MLKFLYFSETANDAVCIPETHLKQIAVDSDSNALTFRFEDIRDGIAEQVTVVVATTQDKGRDIKDAVANAIRSSKAPFIVVADDIRGEYIHPDITNVITSANIGS